MTLNFPKACGATSEDESPWEVNGELSRVPDVLPDFPHPVTSQTLLCPFLPCLPRHLCRAEAGWSTGRGGRAHR